MTCKGCSGTCCTGVGSDPCTCPDDVEAAVGELARLKAEMDDRAREMRSWGDAGGPIPLPPQGTEKEERMEEDDVTVDELARLMSDADVWVHHGDYPGWDDLSTSPGHGQDQYRDVARFLLTRLVIVHRPDGEDRIHPVPSNGPWENRP